MTQTTEVKKIKVPAEEVRVKWTCLEDIVKAMGGAVVFELAMRACDAADSARTWRQKNALKQKLVKAKLEAAAKEAGMTLEEYLEAI